MDELTVRFCIAESHMQMDLNWNKPVESNKIYFRSKICKGDKQKTNLKTTTKEFIYTSDFTVRFCS